MSAVAASKGVVDAYIGQRSQLAGEFRIILFLFPVEAQVFQEQDLARLQCPGHSFRFGSDAVRCHLHGNPQQFRQAGCHRF